VRKSDPIADGGWPPLVFHHQGWEVPRYGLITLRESAKIWGGPIIFLNNTREPLRLKGITDSKLDDWYDPEPFQKIKGDIPMDENFRAGFWPFEDFFVRNFTPEAQLVALEMLAPIGDPRSWTQYLRGKKVLVIHPFDETIRSQFQKREKIFPDFDFLPSFDLIVIPAVQSVGDNSSHVPYDNWFDALETMKEHIRSTDFDIALIGAGAYGLFLAAECKKLNRPAVQIGGALQLLFGITGKRWLDPASPDSALVLPSVNEHWVAPLESEIPMGANKVEGGCYW
jgi:hypothetical protein